MVWITVERLFGLTWRIWNTGHHEVETMGRMYDITV
jgi:hypothetical protein